MWRAGVVSAAPVQLMSDHVFLGSSLAAVLGAEAVLIRLHIARRSGAAAPHLHPAEHPLLWAGAASVSLHILGIPVFSARSALPCTFIDEKHHLVLLFILFILGKPLHRSLLQKQPGSAGLLWWTAGLGGWHA